MADTDVEKGSPGQRSVSGWIAIVSSVVTVVLTVWNADTKVKVDAAEERLKTIETGLHQRAQDVEESKERVARYEWVRSRFADLKDSDAEKKTLTLALIRLALTKVEAEQLFAGLASSSEKTLRDAGQKGLASTQDEAVLNLVTQMNADTAEQRKAATALLIDQYRESRAAIGATLRLFDDAIFSGVSPSGAIDALLFLSKTDPNVWSSEQVEAGTRAIASVERRGRHGTQTEEAIQGLRSTLNKVRASP